LVVSAIIAVNEFGSQRDFADDQPTPEIEAIPAILTEDGRCFERLCQIWLRCLPGRREPEERRSNSHTKERETEYPCVDLDLMRDCQVSRRQGRDSVCRNRSVISFVSARACSSVTPSFNLAMTAKPSPSFRSSSHGNSRSNL
jgi:hypothetical protein